MCLEETVVGYALLLMDQHVNHDARKEAHRLEGGGGCSHIAVSLEREQAWQQLLRLPLYPPKALHRPAHLHREDRCSLNILPKEAPLHVLAYCKN